jgi:hypothetical protein
VYKHLNQDGEPKVEAGADPRLRYKADTNEFPRREWKSLNQKQVNANQARRDPAFDAENAPHDPRR